MQAVPGTEMVHGTPNPTLSAVRPRAEQVIEVSIVMWPRSSLKSFMAKGRHLSLDEFTETHGADPAATKKIERFAVDHGLAIVESSLAKRTVKVSGSIAQMERAFGVKLRNYVEGKSTYRGYEGAVRLPKELGSHVISVMGLENREIARPLLSSRQINIEASCTAIDIATAYRFPMANKGANQCIGIVALKGGYNPLDLAAAFGSLGVTAPAYVSVPATHPIGYTGDLDSDIELALDMQVAGAIASAATIAVYFSDAGATAKGLLDTLGAATTDSTLNPSVLSISWGMPESAIATADLASLRLAFQAAQQLGITVLAASGDAGSTTGSPWPPGFTIGEDGKPHRNPLENMVSHPASDPGVLACGGTSLTNVPGSSLLNERVWNDVGGASGGGVSQRYPVPAWQQGADVAGALPVVDPEGNDVVVGRGVPDVSGHADGANGYRVMFNFAPQPPGPPQGKTMVIGGTSCVAPLFAGLVALINEAKGGRVGFINDVLYANPQVFRDITQGDNGGYKARVGWDACCGLGSPDGMKLARLFVPPQSPRIRVDPASIDFGAIAVSTSAQATLTVFNDGTFEDLDLHLTVQSNGAFNLAAGQPADLVIPAGSASVVSIVFSPGGTNASQGTLQMASNDVSNQQLDVTLSGSTAPANQCPVISRQITGLKKDILSLQAQLSSGDGDKSELITQIRDDQQQIAALRQEGAQLGCPNLP